MKGKLVAPEVDKMPCRVFSGIVGGTPSALAGSPGSGRSPQVDRSPLPCGITLGPPFLSFVFREEKAPYAELAGGPLLGFCIFSFL